MNKKYKLFLFIFTAFSLFCYYFLKPKYWPVRKIVSVYAQDSYFGLGDYIRGIIHLYQNENNSNIYINYETHDISKYLFNDYRNNSDFDREKIQITDETSYQTVRKNSDNLYLYHNASIKYPIDKSILKKVRQMFTPIPEFQQKIDKELDDLVGEKDFIVFHVRLNDDVFVTDRELIDPNLDAVITSINMDDKEIIVMSNSNITKRSLCMKHKLKFVDTIPAHTGDVGVKGDISDTMLEFFIMSKAKQIYQYCENKSQQSGFSQRISELYDIPLMRIV